MMVDQEVHERVRTRLDEYARRVVNLGDRTAIEGHLATCRECRRAAITALESASLVMDEPLRVPSSVWDDMVARAVARRYS
jgi:hypothetical protein